MSEYDNTNRGVLFRNQNKTTDRQPDYRGDLNVDGNEFWLSGWIKTAGAGAQKPGSKFLSISITPKDQSFGTNPKATETGIDEDIPF